MAQHTHDVYDTGKHFEINGISRFIKETSATKLVLVQGDHNSEVITFQMPRYIDGHDMLLCNKIRVHYINLDTKTNDKSADIYEVTDLALCEECEEETLTFTWKIEAPATKYYGSLAFLIKFECTEGDSILYQWNTSRYVGVNVLDGMDNSEEFVEKYSNVLEEWYNELTRGADSIEELNQQALAEIELAKEDAKEDIENKATSTMASMNEFSTNTYNSFKSNVDEKATKALASIPEEYSELDAEVKEQREIIDNFLDESVNILDASHLIENYAINNTNPSEIINVNGHSVSERIQVVQNESYCFSIQSNSTTFRLSYEYNDGTYLYDSVNVTKAGTVKVIPENVVAFRVSGATDSIKIAQIEKGTVKTEYSPYSRKIKSEAIVTDKTMNSEGVPADSKEVGILFDDVNEKIEDMKNISIDSYLIPKKNLIDKTLLVENMAIDTSGNGELIQVNGHTTTDAVQVEELTDYVLSNTIGNTTYRVLYGLNDGTYLYVSLQSFISGKVFTIPENVVSVRFSGITENIKNTQLEKGSVKTEYEEYKRIINPIYLDDERICIESTYKTLLAGKTIVFNGDSILELPYNWGKTFCEYFGANQVNYAIGGSTLAEYGNTGEEPKDRTPLIKRYQSMETNAEVVFISIGTNDWCYSWADIGTDSDEVTTTFKGALHSLCKGLLDMYIGKLVIFVTPIKRCTPNKTNGFDRTLEDYADAIIDVCSQYGFPVIDMFRTCPLNPSIATQQARFFDGSLNSEEGYNNLYNDDTHPNIYGAKVQARTAIGAFKSLY